MTLQLEGGGNAAPLAGNDNYVMATAIGLKVTCISRPDLQPAQNRALIDFVRALARRQARLDIKVAANDNQPN